MEKQKMLENDRMTLMTELEKYKDKHRCKNCVNGKYWNPKWELCPHEDEYSTCTDYLMLVETCEFFKSDEKLREKQFFEWINEYTDYPKDDFIELWNRIVRFIKLNVDFQDSKQYHVTTAWVLANWIPEKWQAYPYLYFFGLPETGKNRAWETLEKISYNSISCTNITVSALFRSVRPQIFESEVTVENGRTKKKKKVVGYEYSTIFLDELNPVTNRSSSDEQNIHRILNAGYRKGGSVIRCVGENFDTKKFPVDGFKSIASIFPIPDALQSRCIMIQMVRSKRRFPMRHDEDEIEAIRTGLEKWRSFALKMPQELVLDEEFIERHLFDKSSNGRLTELYYSLYRVAPITYKNVIVEYLELEAKAKIQNALASFECEIFKAILDVYEKNPLLRWVSTDDVNKEYNDNHLTANITSRTMSRKLRELGFRPHRTAKARGFLVDNIILSNLKERFQIPKDTETSLKF